MNDFEIRELYDQVQAMEARLKQLESDVPYFAKQIKSKNG